MQQQSREKNHNRVHDAEGSMRIESGRDVRYDNYDSEREKIGASECYQIIQDEHNLSSKLCGWSASNMS